MQTGFDHRAPSSFRAAIIMTQQTTPDEKYMYTRTYVCLFYVS